MNRPDQTPSRAPADQQGFALILTVLFTALLFVLAQELMTMAQSSRITGQNDALLARMRSHMVFSLSQVEDTLRDDLEAGAAAGAAQGGEGGGPPAMPASPSATAPGGEPASNVDSSQDGWYEPTSYGDNELTTYTWVEDENRKFNLLSLISPDAEFAREAKERFVRLIDAMREDTEYDLSLNDGDRLSRVILDWLQGVGRSDAIPKPPLKSDDEEKRQLTVPLHLDELLMLQGIDEDLFYDKVMDGKPIYGLESLLTIYTSLKVDPGDPKKQASNQGAGAAKPGTTTPEQPGQSGRTSKAPEAGANKSPGNGAQPAAVNPATGKKEPEQPIGVGIRININTATRPVLRSLFSVSEIPDAVIDAILRYRNEEAPPDEEAAGAPGQGQPAPAQPTTYAKGEYSGQIDEGQKKKKKIFKSLEDLEALPEFANLANPQLKEKFKLLVGVESDVFTIHMASLYKRDEKTRVFVMKRARSIMVRIDDGDKAVLHPLVLLEDAKGLRIMPVDFPEQEALLAAQRAELDQFSAEERDWNPFFLEFYKPREQR